MVSTLVGSGSNASAAGDTRTAASARLLYSYHFIVLTFSISPSFVAFGFHAETESPAETTPAESMRAEPTLTGAESSIMHEAEGESPAVSEATHELPMASETGVASSE